MRLMASQSLPSPDSSGRVRADNLFSGEVPLHDADAWLRELYDQGQDRYATELTAYDLMVRGLRTLLRMEDDAETFRVHGGHVYADFRGRTARLDQLSDGQRTIVALTTDIMSMVHQSGTSTLEAEGIVVVDEIGANLHPS
ncbi:MAG: ATP-binding protein [Proteobacteria bacterium]|nr:ATP-binding protein [Pseudomonadota bacterium]MCP4915876.1 ATP-binding protein [Pseudomonadota bacterium]